MGFIPYGFIQKPTDIFVEPQQAKVVQQIYQRYLEGVSLEGIADFLFGAGIPSPQGKERWTRPVINNLLSNPKYIATSSALTSSSWLREKKASVVT